MATREMTGMHGPSGGLTPLEETIHADEAFALGPLQILPVTDPSVYPENSGHVQSGGLERSAGGRLWITWIAGGDNQNAYAMAAWSDDEGRSWTHPRYIIPNALSPHGIHRSILCSVLWTDPLGRLWWIFTCSLGSFDGRAGNWCSICENPDSEVPRWSAPTRIWHGSSVNRPQVLSDGTWIMGVSLWQRTIINGFPGQWWEMDRFDGTYRKELDPDRKSWLFASRDDGKSWERRGGAAAPRREFDEPSIIERRDGSLLMYLRTYDGLAETESFDQGRTWTEPTPSEIIHPNARIFTCRLRSGRLLMVRHRREAGAPPARDNLTAYLSDDDGKSWYGGLRFEGRSGVSYPDGFQHPDGRIFIGYDHGRVNGSLQMSVFTEEDVAAGRIISGKAILGRMVMRTKNYNGVK